MMLDKTVQEIIDICHSPQKNCYKCPFQHKNGSCCLNGSSLWEELKVKPRPPLAKLLGVAVGERFGIDFKDFILECTISEDGEILVNDGDDVSVLDSGLTYVINHPDNIVHLPPSSNIQGKPLADWTVEEIRNMCKNSRNCGECPLKTKEYCPFYDKHPAKWEI